MYNSSTGKISKGTITNYKIQVFFLFRAGSIKFLYMLRICPQREKSSSFHKKIFPFSCTAQKIFVQSTYKGMRIKRSVKSGKKTYKENRGIQQLIKNRYIKTTKIILPMSFLIDANRVLYIVQCTSRLL